MACRGVKGKGNPLPLNSDCKAFSKGLFFVQFHEIHFWLANIKNFLKALLAPKFESLTSLLTSFQDFFQKFYCSAENFLIKWGLCGFLESSDNLIKKKINKFFIKKPTPLEKFLHTSLNISSPIFPYADFPFNSTFLHLPVLKSISSKFISIFNYFNFIDLCKMLHLLLLLFLVSEECCLLPN